MQHFSNKRQQLVHQQGGSAEGQGPGRGASTRLSGTHRSGLGRPRQRQRPSCLIAALNRGLCTLQKFAPQAMCASIPCERCIQDDESLCTATSYCGHLSLADLRHRASKICRGASYARLRIRTSENTNVVRGWVNKLRRTGQSRHYSAALRPDAEAGHGLGDELVMPAHPVALAELGSGL